MAGQQRSGAYISTTGDVTERGWGLSSIPEMFWGIINGVGVL